MQRQVPQGRLQVLVLAALLVAGSAAAQDAAPRLLAEPTDYTDVIDAFEPDDPFDLDVQLGFTYASESAEISRELGTSGASQVPRSLHVASSSHAVSSLVLGIDAGLWHDLMAYARLPLVLSDTRLLDRPAECSGAGSCPAVDSALLDASGGKRLFTPGFESPTRSGLPSLDLGLAWGVTNQYRTPALPTWVVALESRISVGQIMQPCAAGQASCEPGISRGTARILLSSRWSYRFRYLEPQLGLSFAHEWATTAANRFSPSGDLPGYIDAEPPDVTEGTAGLSIIPWEERGRFQRFTIDLRGHAAYVSAGRDYTPLFDALGSSSSTLLQARNSENIGTGTTAGRQIPFTGLSNVDAHARFGFETALVMQAAQYVRFRLGAGFTTVSPHLLTNAPRCSDTHETGVADARAGECAPNLWNPQYRAVIDLPGNRFRISSVLALDLFAAAIGQF